MLTITEVLLIIIVTQAFQVIHIHTFLRNNSPNGELKKNNNKNYKDINTRNNVCSTSTEESNDELEVSTEEIKEKYSDFDKRINTFKQEVECVKANNDYVKPGEVYELPEDFEPSSLYDNEDVEIITPAYERYMEEKLRV